MTSVGGSLKPIFVRRHEFRLVYIIDCASSLIFSGLKNAIAIARGVSSCATITTCPPTTLNRKRFSYDKSPEIHRSYPQFLLIFVIAICVTADLRGGYFRHASLQSNF